MNATASSIFSLLTPPVTATHTTRHHRRACYCPTAHTDPYTAAFKIGVPA